MAKPKSQDSKPEKVKISIGSASGDPTANAQSKKARDSLWNHPGMDGGFAGEMEHEPGETVAPVDLSGPEKTQPLEPSEPTVKTREKKIQPPPAAEKDPDTESAPVAEPKPAAKPEIAPTAEADREKEDKNEPGEADAADAIYKSDEEFYSSKLSPDNPKTKHHKSAKSHGKPHKYLNPRFVFILTLFITTLLAGVLMLAIMEQQNPGSSLLFDYIPLPEFDL